MPHVCHPPTPSGPCNSRKQIQRRLNDHQPGCTDLVAAAMGVSVARVSQIEHGEVTSFEVIARSVEALDGRLDLVADFGDRTVWLLVTDTAPAA